MFYWSFTSLMSIFGHPQFVILTTPMVVVVVDFDVGCWTMTRTSSVLRSVSDAAIVSACRRQRRLDPGIYDSPSEHAADRRMRWMLLARRTDDGGQCSQLPTLPTPVPGERTHTVAPDDSSGPCRKYRTAALVTSVKLSDLARSVRRKA